MLKLKKHHLVWQTAYSILETKMMSSIMERWHNNLISGVLM